MAKTLRSYIFHTFVLCCVSFAILVTSIATTSWVNANMVRFTGEDFSINYGLFLGTLTSNMLFTPKYYPIRMACIAKNNVCAWSCRTSAEERQQEINTLYYAVENATKPCTGDLGLAKLDLRAWTREQWDETMTVEPISTTTEREGKYPVDQRFINLGVWGATVAALVITIVLSGVAAISAVVNTAANPVHTLAAVPGLFLWNALAAFFAVLTMVLWGSHFAATLIDSVAIRETITGECTLKKNANLGFSYWLILGSALMHLANIGILCFRKVMLERIPVAPKVNPTDDNDGLIFLY